MNSQINFPFFLQAFFTDRLMHQRQASEHTIASYRDTFCLLFKFAKNRLNKEPSNLTIDDLTAPFIGAFLNHLEKDRGNSPRTRNTRLAAIHSFFKYVALHDPIHSSLIQGVLAIPTKRYSRKPIDFLTWDEISALLKAPDKNTWTGRRDWVLILLAVQTGLRLSELIGLTCQDVVLGTGAHVRCRGKGRKERCTPLRKEVITALKSWLVERKGNASDPLFPNARGAPLSRRGVQYILSKHVCVASKRCASLQNKKVSPHVLRHTMAMELLQHGVDRTVIALWLGHENPETTMMYLKADLKIKERALEKTRPFNVKPGRYRPDDKILAFLKDL